MKRLVVRILLILFLLSVLACPSFALKVKVGIFDGSSYYGIDENGQRYGYGYELLDSIAGYAGFEYEYVPGSWAECLTRLRKGEIDLLDFVLFSPARARIYDFSEYSTGMNFCKIYARSDDSRIAYNDFKALNGMKAGLLRGNVQNEFFFEHARANSISTINIEYDDDEILSAALHSGDIDILVTNNSHDRQKDQIAVARFAPRAFYLATPKEEPDLMLKINNAVRQLLIENPHFISELTEKYNLYDTSVMILTEEERQFIKNAEPIKVVYDSFWAPFESFDEKTSGAVGINVDILRLFAQKTGLRFEFLHGRTYEECIEMVSKGEADMLLSYDTNTKLAQALKMVLSNTFLSTPISIFGIKQNIDGNSVFAISRLHPIIEKYVEEVFPKNKIVLFDDIDGCYTAVKSGKADFTLENTYAASDVIRSGKYEGLSVIMVTTLLDKFSFAFKEGISRNVVNILNKAIRSTSTADRERILFDYTINHSSDVSLYAFYQQYRTYIWVVIASFLGFLAFMQMKGKRALWLTAYIDPLTGASNFVKFKIDAARLLKENINLRYIIVKFDIDRFKFLNEIFGVEGGDQILKYLVEAMKKVADYKRETFARVVADEFIFLMTYDSREEFLKKRQMFDHYFYEVYGMGRFSQVIIRSGRYVIDQGETDIHKVLENVNYAHRTVRRQRAVLAWEYDEKTKKDAQRLHEIEGKMGAALEKREFLLYLQPKYALHDNSIAGAEALVRWQDGGGKDLVYPDSFIPLFEKNGFIIKLDMYMLDKVCSVIKYWIEQNIVPTTVSVNFSRLHLTNHPSFLSDVCEVVDRYNIPRELIEVEFTESVSEGNQQTFVDMFEKLHKQGFTLSMDDFGTGYSSLGLLKNIPVDVVKMDKSFFSIVKDEDASRTEAIISSVITMAHFLNIRTVAEGVEEQEQVDFLRSVGCDIVQGYYYSRPLQEKKFTEIVKSSDKRSFLDMKKN